MRVPAALGQLAERAPTTGQAVARGWPLKRDSVLAINALLPCDVPRSCSPRSPSCEQLHLGWGWPQPSAKPDPRHEESLGGTMVGVLVFAALAAGRSMWSGLEGGASLLAGACTV